MQTAKRGVLEFPNRILRDFCTVSIAHTLTFKYKEVWYINQDTRARPLN